MAAPALGQLRVLRELLEAARDAEERGAHPVVRRRAVAPEQLEDAGGEAAADGVEGHKVGPGVDVRPQHLARIQPVLLDPLRLPPHECNEPQPMAQPHPPLHLAPLLVDLRVERGCSLHDPFRACASRRQPQPVSSPSILLLIYFFHQYNMHVGYFCIHFHSVLIFLQCLYVHYYN